MCFKNGIIIIITLIPFLLNAQIKIDDVGDGWKSKVDSALSIIKNNDEQSYNDVIEYCEHISYWLGDYSTTQYPSSIIISTNDIKIKSINNIACLIVHETFHLKQMQLGNTYDKNTEELMAYLFEYSFALKIDNIEDWLILHIIKQIENYQLLIKEYNIKK